MGRYLFGFPMNMTLTSQSLVPFLIFKLSACQIRSIHYFNGGIGVTVHIYT